MTYFCIDKRHALRLNKLMQADGTNQRDIERITLFYILAGNENLYCKRNHIYDFKKHCIKSCLNDGIVDFSSGLRSLIKLGFNLYNGYSDSDMTPLDLFWNLDSRNKQIAENAIRLRFNY